MTPDELRTRLTALFGPDRMETRAAAALRVYRQTVYKWLNGDRPIPKWAISKVEKLEILQLLISPKLSERDKEITIAACKADGSIPEMLPY